MKWRLLFLLMPLSCFGLEVQPWFHPLLEFEFTPSYRYRHYSSVDGGFNPSSYSSNDQFIALALQVSFLPKWDAGLEAEFSDTRKLSWGTQSAAAQVRYLILDDVSGDPVSLTVGLNVRWVPRRALGDVSCPYHSDWNFELGSAIGKEFDRGAFWLFRLYGFLALGQANNGAPYLRPEFVIEGNIQNRHRLKAFLEGYFGFGNTHRVNINRFDGYANIHHQSLDAGASYGYHFEIWGEFSVSYAYRFFARNFPENAHTVMVKYRLPFSIF